MPARWLLLLTPLLLACPKKGGRDAGASSAVRDAGAAPVLAATPPPPLSRETQALLDELAGLRVAFISEQSGQPQVHLLTVGGAEAALTSGEAAHYLTGAQAGGALLTVEVPPGAPLEQLLAVSLDGGVRELTPLLARARSPAVSRDGSFVVLEWGESTLSRLERLELADGGHRPLVNEPTGAFQPALSPDDAHLFYVASTEGDPEVYRRALATGKTERLTAFHLEDLQPLPSPDGKWVAFVSNREGADRAFLMRPDGRGTRTADTGAVGPKDGGAEPGVADLAFSPDGQTLYASAWEAGRPPQLVAIDVASGKRTALTDAAKTARQPVPSADGRYLLFVEGDGAATADVWVLRLEDGVRARLTSHPAPEWRPVLVR